MEICLSTNMITILWSYKTPQITIILPHHIGRCRNTISKIFFSLVCFCFCIYNYISICIFISVCVCICIVFVIVQTLLPYCGRIGRPSHNYTSQPHCIGRCKNIMRLIFDDDDDDDYIAMYFVFVCWMIKGKYQLSLWWWGKWLDIAET